MLAATAWNSLVAIITEHAPWVETGRSAFPLPMRLWTHFLKQLYEFRVPDAEDELHLTSIFRAFAGLDHGSPLSPSAQDKLLDAVVARCGHSFDAACGLVICRGTAMDAPIISAPSSTKNRSGKQNLELRQTNMETNGSSG